MDLLTFQPIIKRALWGGRRLERDLNKPTGGIPDAAESWEVCDLPGSVSVANRGQFANTTLRELMETHARELLGRHSGCLQFPLLVKLIDANRQLSVQVHPNKPVTMADGSSRPGKAEFWIVIDAAPESNMYVGLRPGVTESDLCQAIVAGAVVDCLSPLTVKPGDCLYLEPGTVHALGGNILIAEIQPPSDVTYRLYDWNRVDANGQSREIHLEAGLAATDFARGPVYPAIPKPVVGRPRSEQLVRSPFFTIQRHFGPGELTFPRDDRLHVLTLISGTLTTGLPRMPGFRRGDTVVLPAERESIEFKLDEAAIVLDAFLPDDFVPL